MTAESLNEQKHDDRITLEESMQRQGNLFGELTHMYEAQIKHEKSLSWTSGAYTSAVFITLGLIVAPAIRGAGVEKTAEAGSALERRAVQIQVCRTCPTIYGRSP